MRHDNALQGRVVIDELMNFLVDFEPFRGTDCCTRHGAQTNGNHVALIQGLGERIQQFVDLIDLVVFEIGDEVEPVATY